VTVLYEVREMGDLTPRVQRWVKLFAATSGSLDEACRTMVEAGYADGRTIKSKARKLLRQHRTVINQQVRLRLQSTSRVMAAMATVDELVSDKDVSPAVRLNAAKDVFAKAGLEEAHKVQVDQAAGKLSDQELLEKIDEYQKRLTLVPNE
jgi:hypothetical protein